MITEAFAIVAKDLGNSDINIEFSGSTCVCCIIIGNHIFTANVGDSRAVLYTKKSSW